MSQLSENFLLTEAAAQEIIRQTSAKNRQPMIRIGVRGGGCNGYSYIFEFMNSAPAEQDLVFENFGAKVIIDKKSFIYLKGSELDYYSSMLASGFKLNNQNETASCGCGTSVSF
jgi:iron-sulfur cluster assembly accessory protein